MRLAIALGALVLASCGGDAPQETGSGGRANAGRNAPARTAGDTGARTNPNADRPRNAAPTPPALSEEQIQVRLGVLQDRAAEDPIGASQDFVAATRHLPGELPPAAWLRAAQILETAGFPSGARRVLDEGLGQHTGHGELRKALRRLSDPELLLTNADEHLAADRLDLAYSSYQAALASLPAEGADEAVRLRAGLGACRSLAASEPAACAERLIAIAESSELEVETFVEIAQLLSDAGHGEHAEQVLAASLEHPADGGSESPDEPAAGDDAAEEQG